MRTFSSLSLASLALLAACGPPNYLERRDPVPMGPKAYDTTRDPSTRTSTDKSPPGQPQGEPQPQPPQGEPQPQAMGTTVTYRTVTQVVEKPVEVVREVEAPRWSYDAYAYGVYSDPYARSYYEPRCREPWFPLGTAVGAGIGAVIGEVSNGHATDGAWIGGGIGLLFDLGRTCW